MNCRERKVLSTADGLERTNAHETASTSSSARKKPSKGEKTMAEAVITRPLQTMEPRPAFVTAAPANPPINACELLEGGRIRTSAFRIRSIKRDTRIWLSETGHRNPTSVVSFQTRRPN